MLIGMAVFFLLLSARSTVVYGCRVIVQYSKVKYSTATALALTSAYESIHLEWRCVGVKCGGGHCCINKIVIMGITLEPNLTGFTRALASTSRTSRSLVEPFPDKANQRHTKACLERQWSCGETGLLQAQSSLRSLGDIEFASYQSPVTVLLIDTQGIPELSFVVGGAILSQGRRILRLSKSF